MEQYDRFLLKKRLALFIVTVMTILVAVFYMGIGSMKISTADIFRVFLGQGEKKYQTAILNIRLPRVLAGLLVAPAILYMLGIIRRRP